MGAAQQLLLAAGLAVPAALAGAEQDVLVGSISIPTRLLTPIHLVLKQDDIVKFSWRPIASNLSIVQSSPTEPCAPQPAGFASGFLQSKEGDNNDAWSFKVGITNASRPIFYYVVDGNATVEQRCVAGTYGSVNAPLADRNEFKRLADLLTAFPVQTTASATVSQTSSTGSSGLSPSDTGAPGRNKDEDTKDGLSVGTIAAISVVSLVVAGALFWFFRRRRTRQRRSAERRPTRDSIVDPPPAYVAVQPASISAGSQMTEVWEQVGGRTIMRAPSVASQSQPGTASHAGGLSTSASSSAQTATLDTNPFASPEDDSETATLRASSRPTSPTSSDEDLPPEYMSSHSAPPPFSPVARR